MFTIQSYVLLTLSILLAASVKAQSNVITTVWQAQIYLLKFGYLSPASITNSGTVDENSFSKSVQDFQIYTGVNVTGVLDDKTLAIMSMPRCGVRDNVKFENHNRSKGYVLSGSRWAKNNLTYRIFTYPKNLTAAAVDDVIAKAFALWSEYTDLSFTPKEAGRVNIKIKFVTDEHGDGEPFDGAYGTLAHALFPARGGDIHFDDDEFWTIGNLEGVNLLQVAVHELGHSLGLGHSREHFALMSPFYYDNKAYVKLHIDDIEGIEDLYGKKNKQSGLTPNFGSPRLPPHDELCEDPKIDTIFNSTDGEIFVFKGNKYYKISETALADGYPKLISDGWPGLPGDIDAAFAYKTGKTYFFKGTEYWRYSGRRMDKRFPRSIRDDFVTLPYHLDAAMAWNNNIYFYKGSQVWRYEILMKPKLLNGYPKSISNSAGLRNDLDAAIQINKDVRFYFKGYEYYQVDARTSTVTNAVPPFPRPISQWWFSCKNESEITDNLLAHIHSRNKCML